MGKRNSRKLKQKQNNLQDIIVKDTSDTETASTVKLDKPDKLISPFLLFWQSVYDEDTSIEYFEQVDNELCNDLTKEIQQFKDHMVPTLEDMGPEIAAERKIKPKRPDSPIPKMIRTRAARKMVHKDRDQFLKDYEIADIHSKVKKIHGIFMQTCKHYLSPDGEEHIPGETHCNLYKQHDEHHLKDEITNYENKNNCTDGKIATDQSKGAIPKITANSIKTKMPEEGHFEQLLGNVKNEEDPLSFAVEMAGISTSMMNEESRVPYIPDITCPHEKKTHTIYLRTMFTEDRSPNNRGNTVNTTYSSICLKGLKRSKKGFVTLEPGIFALSLGIPYEDDYEILRTVYPTFRYDSKKYQFEEKVFLLEERVLLHLDNFRTELLCSIFEALLKHKNANTGYIRESDYLILMKQKFSYSLSSNYDEQYNYSSKESRSKFCPGRNSRIEKLFQKQTFK